MTSNLAQKVEQELLRDIEKTGQPLDKISLVEICDAKEGIYGTPGKSRRPVQLRFQKIKELTPRGYSTLLRRLNITPGPSTLEAQATAQDADADEELVLSDDEFLSVIDEEKVINDENIDIDSDTEELPSTFGGLSIKSKPSEIKSKPSEMSKSTNKMFSPEKTKIFSPAAASPPSQQSTASLTDYDHDDSAVDGLDFKRQCGTKSRPYIILADPSHPEQNYPFDITPLEGVEQNDHTHSGFHIRMVVSSPDMNAWKATIPSKRDHPELTPLTGRTVMVKGPSRNYWMRSAELFHDSDKNLDCQVTKTAHEKTDTAIKADSIRQASFFLIVFHKDLVLDNNIFSHNDGNFLKTNKTGMKLKAGHKDNPFKGKKVEVMGMCVWWMIGLAGGERIRDDESEDDADALFV
jgi:hypothetical protein